MANDTILTNLERGKQYKKKSNSPERQRILKYLGRRVGGESPLVCLRKNKNKK
jgi:hypothetical protein